MEGTRALDLIIREAQTNFQDLKHSSLLLLIVLCNHRWGQQVLANNASFSVYVFDRSTENDKQGQLDKFEVHFFDMFTFTFYVILLFSVYHGS